MNRKLSYLLKNTGILMGSNLASKVFAFLILPICTYILSTEEVGIYDAVVSMVSLIFPILTLNITHAVLRFLMDKRTNADDVIAVGMRMEGLGILAAMVGIVVLYITGLPFADNSLYLLTFFYFLSFSLREFMLQYARGTERVLDFGLSGTIETCSVCIFSIIFLVVLHMGLRGFFMANILGPLLSAIYLFIRTKIWLGFKTLNWSNKSLQKEMLSYSVPLITTAIGYWINSTFDKYIVILFCGIEANGLFSVAYKLPNIILIISGIFNQAWYISAVKEYEEEDSAVFSGELFNTLNLCISLVASILICIVPVLAAFLFSKTFYVAWQYVPLLLIGSVFTAASSFLEPLLLVKKDSKVMAVSTISGAIINIGLCIVLVYFIGIQGAAVATVISNAVIYCIRKKCAGGDIVISKYWRIFCIWGILLIQAVCKIYVGNWLIDAAAIIVIVALNAPLIREVAVLFRKAVEKKKN